MARCNYARLANGTKVAMSEKDRAAVLKTVAEMAARPLRVLAMAVKEDVGPLATYDGPAHPSQKLLTNPAKFGALEDDLVFVGLCGIKDPARPEVKPAIQECYTAGIRVVMITGDTQPTAEAIAKEIGIFTKGESLKNKSFTGAEFFALPEKKREARLGRVPDTAPLMHSAIAHRALLPPFRRSSPPRAAAWCSRAPSPATSSRHVPPHIHGPQAPALTPHLPPYLTPYLP